MLRRVLVIDDEQRYLDKVAAIAPRGTWQVEPILVSDMEKSASLLSDRLSSLRPDFCIVDPNLNGIFNGLAAIRIIRERSESPIVVFSQHLTDQLLGRQILEHYRGLDSNTKILTKIPFPSWEELCRAAGLQ